MYEFADFQRSYVRRVVDAELDALFPLLPAVLIDGPKAVGKTATAERRAHVVRRLDREAERLVVATEPGVLRGDERPILIDEWHREPSVFDAVRRLVDENGAGGQFLLTGSAPQRQTHSGAGRITTMRMRPLSLYERFHVRRHVSLDKLLRGNRAVSGRCPLTLVDYVREITGGGFPAMRHLDDRALDRQLDSYLDRIVDHDIPDIGGSVRQPATILAWLRAYAAATSSTTSWEKIRNAASSGAEDRPARTTTIPYTELLRSLRILDPLDPWLPTNNHLTALTSAPKHHLADPALAARLVRSSATQLLQGREPTVPVPRDGTFLGALFESLAALCMRTYAQHSDARVSHLRTKGGRHEVDFIVESAGGGVLAAEVKLTAAVSDADVRQLLWLRNEIKEDCIDLVVLHAGPEAYRRPDGVAVVPLGLLGP
ncbi:MAG: ATP-binding protein [Gemmatimonadaceae bacterium]|nr:ATP-binding protein [Gemmatimonadaceae bacterium]